MTEIVECNKFYLNIITYNLFIVSNYTDFWENCIEYCNHSPIRTFVELLYMCDILECYTFWIQSPHLKEKKSFHQYHVVRYIIWKINKPMSVYDILLFFTDIYFIVVFRVRNTFLRSIINYILSNLQSPYSLTPLASQSPTRPIVDNPRRDWLLDNVHYRPFARSYPYRNGRSRYNIAKCTYRKGVDK